MTHDEARNELQDCINKLEEYLDELEKEREEMGILAESYRARIEALQVAVTVLSLRRVV